MNKSSVIGIEPRGVAALRALATLCEYPTADSSKDVQGATEAVAALEEALPAVNQYRYVAAVEELGIDARQELFVSTFELGAACVPYVSVHLFGEESFKRGAFLSALRGRMGELGFDVGRDLPDHIATMLRFLAVLDRDEAETLVHYCLLGAVTKMRGLLSEGHAYRALLDTVEGVLRWCLPGIEGAPLPPEGAADAACALAGNGCSGTEVGRA